MAVSINDMQMFAESMGGQPDIQISSDIGNVIELGGQDIDDLGMSLLANSRVSAKPASQQQSTGGNTVHVSAAPAGGDFSLGPLEALEPVSLDIPGEGSLGPMPSIQVNREGGGGGGYGGSSGGGQPIFSDNSQTASGPGISLAPPAQRMSLEEERKEKADLLNKLGRLESKGFQITKRFTMDNSLDEIKMEFERLMDARNLEGSIKFQRQMMVGLVTGVELMNNKFNPFDWQLDGWSESVHENLDDFDEVFEELYDKYKGKGNMPPEARLLFMLAGSGFMFHMSNSFFRSKIGNTTMDSILKNNPELAKQMAAAAAQAAGPGFGNFMGMSMGVPQSQPAPMSAPPPQQAPMPQQNMFFNPPNAPPQAMPQQAPPVQRREMKGPSGVDDILRTFEEVRNAEVPQPPPIYSQPPAMPSPNSGPTAQPARQALAEIRSIHSEEARSQAESTMTGRTAGGRRRKPTVPVGNTFSLNV